MSTLITYTVVTIPDVDTSRPVNAARAAWDNPEKWTPGDPIYSQLYDETYPNPMFEYLPTHDGDDDDDGFCVACEECTHPGCGLSHEWGMRWSYAQPLPDEDAFWYPHGLPQLMEFYGATVGEPS